MKYKILENKMENKKWRMKIPHSAKKGFTLIETMVALTVVLVAVVGPISLIGNSLRNIYFARDKMVAINLAQEGIEVVRQKRDSNLLAGAIWDSGLNTGSYVVDAPSLSLTTADTKIYQDTDGFYRQGVGFTTVTQFLRGITITDAGLEEKKVTSTVTWNTGNDTGTITAIEFLFNMPAL
ncbi:MAG: prepilin-type N-terminal cleavage/methylation domain-containing protein [Patescibacteria group bacterium]